MRNILPQKLGFWLLSKNCFYIVGQYSVGFDFECEKVSNICNSKLGSISVERLKKSGRIDSNLGE